MGPSISDSHFRVARGRDVGGRGVERSLWRTATTSEKTRCEELDRPTDCRPCSCLLDERPSPQVPRGAHARSPVKTSDDGGVRSCHATHNMATANGRQPQDARISNGHERGQWQCAMRLAAHPPWKHFPPLSPPKEQSLQPRPPPVAAGQSAKGSRRICARSTRSDTE